MAVRILMEKIAKVIKWEFIDDSAVRENNIQNKAVTEPKYADGSVSTRAIGNAQITEPKYGTGTVSTRALGNGVVTPEKLAPSVGSSLFGLENVDNTSDADKPISTATQAALNGKQANLPVGNSSQYVRGDQQVIRLSSTAVLAQPDTTTGNLNSVTTPGIYSYSGATNLPLGAGSVGTLQVHSTGSGRSQLLVDSGGFAWARHYDSAVWTSWAALSTKGLPTFYGKVDSQVHSANSEERINFTTQLARYVTNTSGLVTVARAGSYRISVTSSGPWKSDAVGMGRGLRIQHNGSTVSTTNTESPIVWGTGLGAFALHTQAFVSAAANDTLEARLAHGTNVSITASHRIEIEWVD